MNKASDFIRNGWTRRKTGHGRRGNCEQYLVSWSEVVGCIVRITPYFGELCNLLAFLKTCMTTAEMDELLCWYRNSRGTDKITTLNQALEF